MAQAIMDPEKVRRFADELQRFNTDLENRLVLLHARFAALGDTWQDQEHEKFSEEFRQALKALKKFNELSNHLGTAQQFGDVEHEVGCGHALLELAGELHADHLFRHRKVAAHLLAVHD